MAEQQMTLKEVLSTIEKAHIIKIWPGEYRIYSDDKFALVRCDTNGKPTSFVADLNGVEYSFSPAETIQIMAKISLRQQQLGVQRTLLERQAQKTN